MTFRPLDIKPIGGEMAQAQNPASVFYTDSGRSSLRLLLRSVKMESALLPEFLCPTIIEIFVEEGVQVAYYPLKDDLTIDPKALDKPADAIYIINYFGMTHAYLKESKSIVNRLVIEDAVFSPVLENTLNAPRWFAYNSYRKFSACVEGSLVETNLTMDSNLILHQAAPFTEKRYRSKDLKHKFLAGEQIAEHDFLSLSQESEATLDQQKAIYAPSPLGYYAIQAFHQHLEREYQLRTSNYDFLAQHFTPILSQEIRHKSFFVLVSDKIFRQKSKLFKYQIFLPGFWPDDFKLKSKFYTNLVAIPIDGRYDTSDMQYLVDKIQEL